MVEDRRTIRRLALHVVLPVIVVAAFALARGGQERGRAANSRTGVNDEWVAYGHDGSNTRYSPLTDIDRTNVSKLRVAWTFHTGDISQGEHGRQKSGFETTPILVDGTLYLTTPFNRIIALDPATGRQLWAYDPHTNLDLPFGDGLINRGVATWLDSSRAAGAACRRRIFEATLDARLVAVDADTGKPCDGFGRQGVVTLQDVAAYRPGWYHMTSPPAVIDDLVVVGSAIDDNVRTDMPNGVVRAYDARTGAIRWRWDPIPANLPDSKEWETGAANAWSVMAVDTARHRVFVPTGSASPDFYGGKRLGDNKWANSIVALDSRSGKMAWGFQLVHHDLWDYDTAAPPVLAAIARGGRKLDAVVAGNKSGYLYVLDRDTGAPLLPVKEQPVPQTDVPGEETSPTQPVPATLPALSPQKLAPEQAWGVTPEEREECRGYIARMRHDGIFTPPALAGTVVAPGFIGGMNWSGYAFDSSRQLLVVNTNNLPFWVQLLPREKMAAAIKEHKGDVTAQVGAPFAMQRRPLMSHSGFPCTAPPWGLLTAVDLAEGKIRWQVTLGSMRDLTPYHFEGQPGSPSLGGPIVTAGGLVFIAGTIDPFLRAFDIDTGKELWKAELPASGHATPMTYRLADGKQYVVIAAGGHAKIDGEKPGDTLVAFALP